VVNEEELALKESYVGALSALVRGEFIPAKEKLYEQKGAELIKLTLEQEQSMRICKKLALLLNDLFYYDTKSPGFTFTKSAVSCGLLQVILDRFACHGDLELRELMLRSLVYISGQNSPASD
jgi:hypothetical protein